MKTALIFGSSGLIGNELLKTILLKNNYSNIKIFVRTVPEINNSKVETEKFIFNASKNPKDKGPFPEYTLWYQGDELLKMEFQNPNDKKTVTIIRSDWSK